MLNKMAAAAAREGDLQAAAQLRHVPANEAAPVAKSELPPLDRRRNLTVYDAVREAYNTYNSRGIPLVRAPAVTAGPESNSTGPGRGGRIVKDSGKNFADVVADMRRRGPA